jgi:hypothetical protein
MNVNKNYISKQTSNSVSLLFVAKGNEFQWDAMKELCMK